MNKNILEIKNLNINFETREGQFAAVNDVSFNLKNNQSIGIIGESGCGKSTLAYSLMGYVAPNGEIEGEILFKGENLLAKGAKELVKYRGNRIAMVFQNPEASLNPALTIGEQLDEVSIHHQSLTKRRARVASIEALELMNIGDPQGIVRRYPHQLSGGIQQRISIAMALLCRPDLMILDEPTTALDVTTEAVILESINQLRKKLKMSLVYISHDMGVINKVSEQIVVMYNGEIVEKGPKHQIFDHPNHPYTRALINCMPRGGVVKEETQLNTIPGYVKKRGVAEKGCPFVERCEKWNSTCESLYGMRQVGKEHIAACDRAYATDTPEKVTPPPKPKRVAIEGAEVLKIEQLHKVYGTRRKTYALNGIDLEVQGGSVLGIVGESGCGKSTTGHLVSGLYKPSKGEILFKGENIGKAWNRRSKETLKEIQLIFQNPGGSLNPSHTVEQLIGRPMKLLSDIPTKRERQRHIKNILKRVDLGEEYLTKKPGNLSGGEQQRVAIARALSTNPTLVVCDEPTSALDVSVQASVLNLLNSFQSDEEITYLFISHDLHVVNYISDYIVVMYAGKVFEYGKRDEVMYPPFHPYTEALLSAMPEVDPKKEREVITLTGQLPDPSKRQKGCPFAGRCPKQVGSICEEIYPPKVEHSPTHYQYCHIKY